MTDGVTKGTGNSRYLKSVSNFLSLYPTYADFVAALVAGTLPIDLNGLNAEGWTTLATALNKANLLSDTTAAALASALGITAPTTPNEALAGLATPMIYKKLLSTTVGTAALAVTLDLSSLSTTQYTSLIVLCNLKTVSGGQITVRMNGVTSGYLRRLYSNGGSIGTTTYFNIIQSGTSNFAFSKIELFYNPAITATQTVLYNSISAGEGDIQSGVASLDVALSAGITSLTFTSGYSNIAVGSTFTVYGVKK